MLSETFQKILEEQNPYAPNLPENLSDILMLSNFSKNPGGAKSVLTKFMQKSF